MTLTRTATRRLLDPSVAALANGNQVLRSNAVLMFSGGRDSSIAAIRLAEQGFRPLLVTVSSWHLLGVERVKERVAELDKAIQSPLPWVIVKQPESLKTDTSFYEQTCLPCQHAYVVAGAVIAAKTGIKTLAFGYASYQNSWPEQTPEAVDRLTQTLSSHGIDLVMPVYDLASRENAVAELRSHNLRGESLEQKCIRQVTNVTLPPEKLNQQIDLWVKAIDASMRSLNEIDIDIVEASRFES